MYRKTTPYGIFKSIHKTFTAFFACIYRIEKKEQTYESQRKVSVASVLKGAVELRTVYPMQNGKSTEDGFEAYVFTDAEVITGTNYDCDDVIAANAVVTGSFTVTKSITADSEEAARTAALSATITDADIAYKDAQAARITAIIIATTIAIISTMTILICKNPLITISKIPVALFYFHL